MERWAMAPRWLQMSRMQMSRMQMSWRRPAPLPQNKPKFLR